MMEVVLVASIAHVLFTRNPKRWTPKPIPVAGHIRSYADRGEHEASNGLLLRTNIHTLFDRGYATVTPDLRFAASGRPKAGSKTAGTITKCRDGSLTQPLLRWFAPPSPAALCWHAENRSLG